MTDSLRRAGAKSVPRGERDHFSRVAQAYAAARPRYPPELFAFVAAACARRELAWDCACGSGQATLALAEHFARVVASDSSAAQIAAAPAHPRIAWRTAPAEASGLEPGTVDLVTVAQALHWFDLEPFYAEVRRVLAPGGVLAVWTYGVQRVEGAEVDALVQRFYRETVGPYWPPERRHCEDGYRMLPFPFAQLQAPPFRMAARWPLERFLDYLRSWSATGRYVAATGADPVAALGQALAPLWGGPGALRLVTWPLAVRVGRTG